MDTNKKFKIRKPHLLDVRRMSNPGGNRIELVRLDKNERTTPFPEQLWKDFLSSLTPDWVTVYPEVTPLIEAIAKFDRLDPSQVFLTAGSDVGIKACFESFVEPGDEVVYLAPSFAMVDVYLKLFRAKPKPVMTKDHFEVSVDEILDAIQESTSFFYLANPNSPSGIELSLPELEKVIQKTGQFGIPTLIDEAYFFFTDTTAMSLIQKYPHLLVVRTFSKAWGMAGARLGYVAGQAEIIELVSKWRPMYEVNSLAVKFAMELLKNPESMRKYTQEVREAKKQVEAFGKKYDLRVYPSGANFVNVYLGKDHVQKVVALAEQKQILVKSAGSGFGQECLRISCGVPSQVSLVLDLVRSVKESEQK